MTGNCPGSISVEEKKKNSKSAFPMKETRYLLRTVSQKAEIWMSFFASSVLITNTSKRWWDITNQERKGLESILVSQEYWVWYDCSWRTAWWAVGIYFGGLCNTVSYLSLQWDCKMANNKKDETPNSLASIPRTVTEHIIKLLVNI